MIHNPDDLTEKQISELLAKAHENRNEYSYPAELFADNPKSAAVLIPFLREKNTWQIVFTRRTDTLPEHSGQVAFPGGRAEPGDTTAEATALREAYEEIDLKPGDVEILGKLNSLPTVSNYCVTPVVGKIPWPYTFKIEKNEVSRVFRIPLRWLADPKNHELRLREVPRINAPVRVIYFKSYQGELLWGVSAQITLNLLKALDLI
jgi:8-oxo-dGTP pyrophosphatase MutT (NUDIX family)